MATNPLDMTTQSPVTIGGGTTEPGWQDAARDVLQGMDWQDAARQGLPGWEDAAKTALGLGSNSYLTSQITPYYAGGGKYVAFNSSDGSGTSGATGGGAAGAGASSGGYPGGTSNSGSRTQIASNGQQSQQGQSNSLLGGLGGSLVAGFLGQKQEIPNYADPSRGGVSVPGMESAPSLGFQQPTSTFGSLLSGQQFTPFQAQQGVSSDSSQPTPFQGITSSSGGSGGGQGFQQVNQPNTILAGTAFNPQNQQWASALPLQGQTGGTSGTPQGQTIVAPGASTASQPGVPEMSTTVPQQGSPAFNAVFASPMTAQTGGTGNSLQGASASAQGVMEPTQSVPNQPQIQLDDQGRPPIKDSKLEQGVDAKGRPPIKDSKLEQGVDADTEKPLVTIGGIPVLPNSKYLKAAGQGAVRELADLGRGIMQVSPYTPIGAAVEPFVGDARKEVLKQAPAQRRYEAEQYAKLSPTEQKFSTAGGLVAGSLPYLPIGGTTSVLPKFLMRPAAWFANVGKDVGVKALTGAGIGALQYAESTGDRVYNSLMGASMSTALGIIRPLLYAGKAAMKGIGKVTGINALGRKLTGAEKYAPTEYQIDKAQRDIQRFTLDPKKSSKLTEALKQEEINTILPNTVTGSAPHKAIVSSGKMTPKGASEIEKRVFADQKAVQQKTDTMLKSMLPKDAKGKPLPVKQVEEDIKKLYADIDKTQVSTKEIKPLLENKTLESHLVKMRADPNYASAKDFKLTEVGQWRKFKQYLQGQKDKFWKDGMKPPEDLEAAYNSVQGFLNKADTRYKGTNKEYAQLLTYNKYKDTAGQAVGPDTRIVPDTGKLSKALVGTRQQQAELLKDIRRLGGDQKTARNMVRILGSLDEKTMQRVLSKNPALSTPFMEESGFSSVATGFFSKLFRGHKGNQLMNLYTNPKYKERIYSIYKNPDKVSRASQLLDLINKSYNAQSEKPKVESKTKEPSRAAIKDSKISATATENKSAGSIEVDGKQSTINYVPEPVKEQVVQSAKNPKAKKMIEDIMLTSKSELDRMLDSSKGRATILKTYVAAGGDPSYIKKLFADRDGLSSYERDPSSVTEAIDIQLKRATERKKTKEVKTEPQSQSLLIQPQSKPLKPPKKQNRRLLIPKTVQQKRTNTFAMSLIVSLIGDSKIARLLLSMMQDRS